MKNLSRKKGWGMDTNLSHAKPPTIPLINEKYTSKSYGDYVKLKLCRDPTSSTSDLYYFRMYLLYHNEKEDFILFVRNSQITITATGTIEM